MSTSIRDLWPADIKSDDIVSPAEILNYQATQLQARTGGRLLGHVVRTTAKDRVILGFEIESVQSSSTARLFSVEHRPEFEYPVLIRPPKDELPSFLKEEVYVAGTFESMESIQGRWVANEWVASSPEEFSEKVERVLSRADVKAAVLSMMSRPAGTVDNGQNGS